MTLCGNLIDLCSKMSFKLVCKPYKVIQSTVFHWNACHKKVGDSNIDFYYIIFDKMLAQMQTQSA